MILQKTENKPGAIIIEGHIQGLSNVRSLGEAGIPVYVVDKTNCIARYSRYCSKFFRVPDFINDEFADSLIDLAEKENIRGWVLIPSNDHAVMTISRNRKRLEEYYKLITPSLEITQNIYDKSLLLKIAEDAEIPVPVTFYFSSIDDLIPKGLKYPVLTKGRNGLTFYKATRKKAFVSENEKELKENLSRIAKGIDIAYTFTQEVIPPCSTIKTVSFTAFSVDGIVKTYWMGEKLREHPLQFGTATFCQSLLVEELIDPSAKLLEALNYTGVCEIEYIKDPRDNLFKLIEINARTWLWVGLARVAGIDYARIIYDYMNDREVIYPKFYKRTIKWSNHVTDIVYSLIAIFQSKLTFSGFFSSYKGEVISAVYKKTDWRPVLFYFLFLFKFIKNR